MLYGTELALYIYNLLELVQSMVLAGISISPIANTLENNRYKMYFRFKNMYHKIHTYFNAPEMLFLTVNQFEDLFGTELTPLRHSISNIFLAGFWKHEHLYFTEMKKTTVSKQMIGSVVIIPLHQSVSENDN